MSEGCRDFLTISHALFCVFILRASLWKGTQLGLLDFGQQVSPSPFCLDSHDVGVSLCLDCEKKKPVGGGMCLLFKNNFQQCFFFFFWRWWGLSLVLIYCVPTSLKLSLEAAEERLWKRNECKFRMKHLQWKCEE